MLKKLFNDIPKKIADLSDFKVIKPDSYMRTTGGINLGLLSFVQAGLFLNEKDMPKETKKFAVAQEVIEGTLKIALLVAVAYKFKVIGKNQVLKRGNIRPNWLHEKNFISKDVKGEDFFHKMNDLKKENVTFAKEIEDFSNNVGSIFNLVGMVGAVSFLLVPARNVLAKKSRELQNAQLNKNKVHSTPTFKSMSNMQPYYKNSLFNYSSLKI